VHLRWRLGKGEPFNVVVTVIVGDTRHQTRTEGYWIFILLGVCVAICLF
jgi:hypothetical protein